MSLQKLMNNYAEFNLWANQTIASWLMTKPQEFLDKEVLSSYPSVMKTVKHIWDTERFWLLIMQNDPPKIFSPKFEGSPEDTFSGFLQNSKTFVNYVNSLTENDMLQISELDMPWMKGSVPKYELVQHCLNHSTYHRGQIITIGRNIGFTDPPMTDYNYYNMAIKPGLGSIP